MKNKRPGNLIWLKSSSLCLALSLLLSQPIKADVHVSGKTDSEHSSLQQEKKELKGVVLDQSGTPIIGANVVQKGLASNGTITDVNGEFTLNIAPNSTIIVSYIGYTNKEINIGRNNSLTIKLEEDTELLSEVVVTALGLNREKKALGYAMTELKGDELQKSNIVNPVNALQGKVAGVQINMGASGPQSSQRILIRGNTSISENNQPIFVIDGIIIDNDAMNKQNKFDRDFGNDLKNLNSDDFETVSVLKGAAATALYGSRASNGVILITTKKGKRSEGLGISFSQTQQWEHLYGTPHFQNEFGSGAAPAWKLLTDGTENRNLQSGRSFGPKFDNKPYTIDNKFEGIYKPYPNNLRQMYRTGRYVNTNIAVSGGNEKSTFRVSYSNLNNDGITLNNSFSRNSISFNASQEVSKYLSADAGFSYVGSDSKNPSYQGGDFSPVYDFAFSVPRDYDTEHWKKNYWNEKRDGWNENDPSSYSFTLFNYLENNELQNEDNYRGYFNLNFKFTNWLKAVAKADMNRMYVTRESKTLALGRSNFQDAGYTLSERKKLQNKITAMLMANHSINNFSFNMTLGVEQFNEEQSWHYSRTNNGLRVPGVFDLSNSVDPATTAARNKVNRKRMNSAFGFINADWKGQVYLDFTGRNDWSSTLRYSDGSGNVSYFYPSLSGSWIASETLTDYLPKMISFVKLRASYAIVGKDTNPYLINESDRYIYDNSFADDYFNTGTHPYFDFSNNNLGALNLKPEKQHAIELGLDYRMFNNRLGLDFAYYKTNTRNQILDLPISPEVGVSRRIINAGDIQNSGIELLLTAIPIQTKDLVWDLSLTYTRNRNTIKALYPGVTKYQLKTVGSDTEAWASVGGSYGDIYSSYAYLLDENGNKLLNPDGGWIRSGEQKKIGSLQPDFLAGFSSSLKWKGFTLGVIVDSRFGGDVFSASYNYGMSSGTLHGSLKGRTKEYGGLPREISEDDKRVINDGMIPDGVFRPGAKNKEQVDLSGMSYQKAYEEGLVKPLSAYEYYDKKFSWSRGIREAAIHKLSWIALREVSLYWDLPQNIINKAFIKSGTIGLVVRNAGYLYNSLPDNIHPEGLQSNRSSEYLEAGGNVFSRNYGVKLNLNF